jgi:archaellum component FlaC
MKNIDKLNDELEEIDEQIRNLRYRKEAIQEQLNVLLEDDKKYQDWEYRRAV